jgi:hypothetical protein
MDDTLFGFQGWEGGGIKYCFIMFIYVRFEEILVLMCPMGIQQS